jgi:hypothetical protein
MFSPLAVYGKQLAVAFFSTANIDFHHLISNLLPVCIVSVPLMVVSPAFAVSFALFETVTF